MLKLERTFTWKGGRSEGCHKLGSRAQVETPWRHAGNIRTWLILAVGGEEESKGMPEFLSCLVPLKYGLQSSADPPFLQEPIDYNTGLPSVSHNSCEKSQDMHLSLSLQQHDGHPAATLPRSYSHCARGVHMHETLLKLMIFCTEIKMRDHLLAVLMIITVCIRLHVLFLAWPFLPVFVNQDEKHFAWHWFVLKAAI